MKSSQKIIFSKSSNALTHNSSDFGSSRETSVGSSSQESSVIYRDELNIIVGNTTHTSGSSAVATRNVTNYPWDPVYLPGNLIAVHCSGSYIAYALQAPQAKKGMVRIVHRTTEARGLVKNIPGIVKDLSFSHHADQILLSFVDHFGTLFVYKIYEETSALATELKLEVPACDDFPQSDSEWEISDYHRVIWCPFIPEDPTREIDEDADDGDEENFAYLLVVTNGPIAEIWHLASILQLKSGTLKRSDIVTGHRAINEHSAPITDAAFSPDGTALATASLDGYVKFFQVYMVDEDSNPRCIHQWKPHAGQPLSCLFFLDNHKSPNPDIPFWKFAITGACNNTELKIWSCETWHCHQTLKFEASPNLELNASKLHLKAVIDPSAKFLLLSDIHRRVLYVLILNQELTLNGAASSLTNGAKMDNSPDSNSTHKFGDARFISITELPIQYSVIFLTITDASFKHYKRWKHEHAGSDLQAYTDEGDDDHDDIVEGLVMKCMFINPKSFQEATIRFQPALPIGTVTQDQPSSDLNISSSQDSVGIKDGLSDLSLSLGSSMSDVEPPPMPSKGMAPQAERDPSTSPASGLSRPSSLADSSSLRLASSSQNSVPEATPTAAATSFASSKPLNLLSTPTSSISLDAVASLPVACVSSSLPSPPHPTHIRQMSSPMDASSSSQGVPLTLLTPESFSSPRRVEDEVAPNDSDVKGTPSPTELEESLSRWCSKSEVRHSAEPRGVLHEGSNDLGNVLQESVSGSSKSPIESIPTCTKAASSPLDSKEGPLATSEMVATLASNSPTCFTSIAAVKEIQGGGGSPSLTAAHSTTLAAASSTSSPSLEVQSILHSNEDENEDSEGSTKAVDFSSLENGEFAKSDATISAPVTTCLVDLPELDQTAVKDPLDLLYKSLSEENPPQGQDAGLPPRSLSQAILSPTVGSIVPPPPPPLRSLSADGPQGPSARVATQRQSLQALIQLGTAPSASSSSSTLNGETKLKSDLSDILSEIPFTPRTLPSGKGHITCAQLEAEIKSISPVRKVQGATSLPCGTSSTIPMAGTFSPFVPSTSSFALQDPFGAIMEKAASTGAPAVVDNSQKVLEEISSLKELMSDRKEKNKGLAEQVKSLSIQLDKTLKSLNQITKQVDDLRKAQSKMQDPHHSQAVIAAAKPAFESIIRHEIKQALQPALNKSVETARYQLSSEIRTISEQVSKSIQSRNFSDNLSSTIAAAINMNLQGGFREIINKTLLPAFSSVSQQMFSQLNDAFTKGTKEYMQYVETESQATRKSFNDHALKYSRNLEASTATLTSQTNSFISLVDNLNKTVVKQTNQCEGLEDRLRQALRDEVSRSFESNRMSRSQTPVPKQSHTPTNPKVQQQQIQQLISQGKINMAFKQALSASDLGIVVFVCERVNPQQLFMQSPCPLTQDVLLSLINQLSHDLGTFTDLKTKYLEEAVLNLDKSHPVTMEHFQDVLLGFQRSLSAHLSLHPNHKKLSLLLMAVNHLVGSTGAPVASSS